MEGRVLSEIFAPDSPGAAAPRFVATYETPSEATDPFLAGEGDPELYERLRALGYIR